MDDGSGRFTRYHAGVPTTRFATVIGLAGTSLLAIAAWLASPWGLGFAGRFNTVPVRAAHALPAIFGLAAVFIGWLRLGVRPLTELWHTFALWVLPLLVCPPLLSKDAWAYLEQGWIVLQGFDPYLIGLSTLGGPFGGRVDSYWQGTTPVYPPLALLVQAAVVALSGAHSFWSLLAMRLPGLIAMLAIGACLPGIARAVGGDPRRAVWFGLLNPLALVHFIGGMHNDSWATALGVLGVWLAARRPRAWLLGCGLVGLGMAIKQPIGLLMVPICLFGVAVAETDPAAAWRRVLVPALWRLPLGLAATLAGFAIPTLASGWGLGWAKGSGAPFTAGSQSVAHTVAAGLEKIAGWPMARCMVAVGPVFMGIGVLLIGWLGWRFAATRPLAFGAWGLVVFAFTYPSLQPWYALWGGLLLGAVVLAERTERWVIAVLGCLLATGVLLDYAGWPIPIAQLAAIVLAWPLSRLAAHARMAAITT